MIRTPTEDKALAWFCKEFMLTPQLSAHPTYYFVDRDGNQVIKDLLNIVVEYKRQRKAEKPRKRKVHN